MITVRTIHRNSTSTITNSIVVTSMRRNSGSVRSATRRILFAAPRDVVRLAETSSAISRLVQRLLDVPDQVFSTFDADAQPRKPSGMPALALAPRS